MVKELMKNDSPICYCGSLTEYKDSRDYYHGKSYGMRYICIRWPECRGSVGAHPDGKPLGTVPDDETKRLRGICHGLIDPLWQNAGLIGKEKHHKRNSVYKWMCNLMELSRDEAHIGMFDASQCRQLIRRVKEVPYDRRREFFD